MKGQGGTKSGLSKTSREKDFPNGGPPVFIREASLWREKTRDKGLRGTKKETRQLGSESKRRRIKGGLQKNLEKIEHALKERGFEGTSHRGWKKVAGHENGRGPGKVEGGTLGVSGSKTFQENKKR